MKINRNLIISVALAALVIAGIINSKLKSDSGTSIQQSNTQAHTQDTSSPAPVQSSDSDPVLSAQDSAINQLVAGNIWTYDCEIPVQLPDSFLLTCGDGGWYVHDIKWKTWTKSEALATAIFSQNVCDPDCADGYRVEAPVNLKLTTFAKPGEKIYLTNLEMTASTRKNFADGNRSLTWDLGEFAKMMESN